MSTGEQSFDPRVLAAELPGIAERSLSMDTIALPCGRVACMPFSPECIQSPEQPPELAVRAAAMQMAISRLGLEVDEQTARAEEYRLEAQFASRLAERLSVDKNLNILTFNSQKVLYEHMESTGLLARLHAAGYTTETLVLDMDLLGGHNIMGGHEGGTRALEELARAIRPLYRRKTDFMGILGYRKEAEAAIDELSQFSQVGRYERGDEIIAVSFMPPNTRRTNRRDPTKGLEEWRDKIVEALNGKIVRYPLLKRKSLESLQKELRKKGAENMEYRIVNRMVEAPISAAFAIIRHPVPLTLAEFEHWTQVADTNMIGVKEVRNGSTSRGAIANFLPS